MAWQFNSKQPVFKQIVSHIRADILNGVYQPEQQIPPVRTLALEAGVNPNTMQRALADLEAEGLLISRGTVGRFVTSDTQTLDKSRAEMRQETIERLISDAAARGITREELIAYLSSPPAASPPDNQTDN
ncbi:MAG: GntR family transcriptional regulator [Clostridia bacterium]|nr:GntR family transcriptional regulator [Clostridia bacterium]